MHTVRTLSTPAWLLAGPARPVPGILYLDGTRVVFETTDGIVFNAPLNDVVTKFPWYSFGGGMQIGVGRNTYRLSFAKPNSSAAACGFTEERKYGRRRKILSFLSFFPSSLSRHATREWRNVLTRGSR